MQILRVEYAKKGASEELLSKLRAERQFPPKALEDVEGSTLEFDLLLNLGRKEEAALLVNSLLVELDKYKIGDGNLRQLWSRKILSKLPEKTAQSWLTLLAGQSSKVPGLEASPSQLPWLLNYLYLRNHRFSDRDRDLLDSIVQRPVPSDLPNSFAVEWWKFIGTRRFELKEYDAASLAFQTAAAIAPEGSREAIMLMHEEAIFLQRQEKARDRMVH
jgi:hypothetical protein